MFSLLWRVWRTIHRFVDWVDEMERRQKRRAVERRRRRNERVPDRNADGSALPCGTGDHSELLDGVTELNLRGDGHGNSDNHASGSKRETPADGAEAVDNVVCTSERGDQCTGCEKCRQAGGSRATSSGMIISSAANHMVSTLRRLMSDLPLNEAQSRELQAVVDAVASGTLHSPRMFSTAFDIRQEELRGRVERGSFDRDLSNWLQLEFNVPVARAAAIHTEKRQRGPRMSDATRLAVASKVKMALERRLEWDFDIFTFAEADPAGCLQNLAMAIFEDHGLCPKFNISPERLKNFLTAMQEGYQDVPYHAAIHAADVLQSLNVILVRCNLVSWMTDLEILACLIAAIAHDYKHPGCMNSFLVRTRDEKAVLYNDRAVLENYHCASMFMDLKDPNKNILEGLKDSEFSYLRELVIALILGTDMAEHFVLVSQFDSLMSGPGGLSHEDPSQRKRILQMALKCADIGNSSKPTPLHRKWTERIYLEFFQQGEREKELALTMSAMCDRSTTNIVRSQLGFLQAVVNPMYDTFSRFCPPANGFFKIIEINRAYWQALADQGITTVFDEHGNVIPYRPMLLTLGSSSFNSHGGGPSSGIPPTPTRNVNNPFIRRSGSSAEAVKLAVISDFRDGSPEPEATVNQACRANDA